MTPPAAVALTIAGSDSGGGAGLQADLRAFHAFGVHGTTVVTALTAQNPQGVRGVVEVDPAFVVLQARAVLEAYSVTGVKTGMLASAGLVTAVASILGDLRTAVPRARVVVDPVMVATSGARLLGEDARGAVVRELLPLADVVTPNLPEAAELLGDDPSRAPHWTRARIEDAARALLRSGCRAVLLKGGHGAGPTSDDLLATSGASRWLSAPRIEASSTHGTGCTLSAALAAGVARGWDLDRAARSAKAFLTDALSRGLETPPPPFESPPYERSSMTIRLTIGGMTCAHCVKSVTEALQALPGARAVVVEVGKATFEADAPPDESALRRALQDEGYELLSMSSSG